MYPIVDLWRAIAVLLVVIAHTLLWFGNPIFLKYLEPSLLGTTGVAIFFVLTSYVLMLSMERIKSKSKNFYLDFLNRRFFRIYPLSIVIVIFYFLTNLPAYFPDGGELTSVNSTFAGFLQNLLLIQNFTIEENMIGPLWSLPYEFQMYLLLPLIFLFFTTKDKKIQGLFLFFILCLAFFVANEKVSNINDKLMYFQIPNYAKWGLCFIPGVIAYYIQKDLEIKKINFNYFWPILLLILFSRMLDYDFFIQILSAILVGFSLILVNDNFNSLLKSISIIISKYSYGIYLTHMLSIYLGFELFGNTILGWSIFLGSLVLFPFICFHLIENPFIKLGKKISIKYFER